MQLFLKRLTVDHCASDPEERQRIIDAGGEVTQDEFGSYRVNRSVIPEKIVKITTSIAISDFSNLKDFELFLNLLGDSICPDQLGI